MLCSLKTREPEEEDFEKPRPSRTFKAGTPAKVVVSPRAATVADSRFRHLQSIDEGEALEEVIVEKEEPEQDNSTKRTRRRRREEAKAKERKELRGKKQKETAMDPECLKKAGVSSDQGGLADPECLKKAGVPSDVDMLCGIAGPTEYVHVMAGPEAWKSRNGKLQVPSHQAACCSTRSSRASSGEKAAGAVMGLTIVEPHGINAVSEDQWVQVEANIDSGATETVIPEETLAGVIDISEGAAFKRGVQYEVADGTKVPNLGERRFVGFTEDGRASGVVAQVCAVNKMLMSVSKMTKNGNKVVFDDEGSYVEDKASGARSWMTEKDGMYALKIWVSRRSTAEAGF